VVILIFLGSASQSLQIRDQRLPFLRIPHTKRHVRAGAIASGSLNHLSSPASSQRTAAFFNASEYSESATLAGLRPYTPRSSGLNDVETVAAAASPLEQILAAVFRSAQRH
jgi:hypothetical protein